MDQWDLFNEDKPGSQSPEPGQGPVVPSRRAMREAEEAASRSKKRGKQRRSATVLVTLILVLALAVVIIRFGGPMVKALVSGSEPTPTSQADYPGPGSDQTVLVDIASGANGSDMAKELAAKGVVASAGAFESAFIANPRAPEIQPGTYRLRLEMRAADAVMALLDSANREASTQVVVSEGLRAAQVFDRLAKALDVPVAEIQAAAEDASAIGLPAEAQGNVEGWLFPATYNVTAGSTPTSMLAEMVSKTKTNLIEMNVAQSDWLATLTMASIVEKEISRDEDRAKAAQVIYNRLEANMPLGMDSTVHYGVGNFDDVETTPEQRADDNPYNTYLHTGLPVGPISNPGVKALQAVLFPADGAWLYFVTVDLCTGETEFNITAAEHDVSVEKYRAWVAANPDWDKPDGCAE